MTQAERNIIEAIIEIYHTSGLDIHKVNTANEILNTVEFHVPAHEYYAMANKIDS